MQLFVSVVLLLLLLLLLLGDGVWRIWYRGVGSAEGLIMLLIDGFSLVAILVVVVVVVVFVICCCYCFVGPLGLDCDREHGRYGPRGADRGTTDPAVVFGWLCTSADG